MIDENAPSDPTRAESKADAELAKKVVDRAYKIHDLLGDLDLRSSIQALEAAKRFLLVRHMKQNRSEPWSKPEPNA